MADWSSYLAKAMETAKAAASGMLPPVHSPAGALANAISRSYLGQPISILSSYNIGFKRVMALIAASLIPFASSLAFVAIIAVSRPCCTAGWMSNGCRSI